MSEPKQDIIDRLAALESRLWSGLSAQKRPEATNQRVPHFDSLPVPLTTGNVAFGPAQAAAEQAMKAAKDTARIASPVEAALDELAAVVVDISIDLAGLVDTLGPVLMDEFPACPIVQKKREGTCSAIETRIRDIRDRCITIRGAINEVRRRCTL